MSTHYNIPEKVWGTYGPDTYEYEPGEVEPKDAAEARILEHLINIGRAAVIVAAPKLLKKRED